jgi:uronate dehydrogenase
MLAAVPTILITGAAGIIGTMLRPRLARPDRTLRLLDIAEMTAGPAEEVVRTSVTEMDAMTAASRGCSAVIHLAGISGEASWADILQANIQGTYVAFEAARRAGVPRVIFASSNHAVGFSPRESFPVPDYAFPAPDTYYGVAKVTGEALAGLYHYRYGLDTIAIRILTSFGKPPSARALSTWLSPDDTGRLFEACLTTPDPGFRVVYGVSANTRGGWVSLREAEALGYSAQDDAESLADEVIAEFGEPDPADPVLRYLGGEFTLPGLDAEIP